MGIFSAITLAHSWFTGGNYTKYRDGYTVAGMCIIGILGDLVMYSLLAYLTNLYNI